MNTSELSTLLPSAASAAVFPADPSSVPVDEASENLLSYAEGGLDGKHPPSDAVAETLRGVVELYESLGEESVPMDELTERLRNSESEGLRRLAEMPELLRGLDAEGTGGAPNEVVSKEAVGSFIQKTDALLQGLPAVADAARRGLTEDAGGRQGAEPEASKGAHLSHLLIEVGLGAALAAGAVATVVTAGAAAPLEAELGAVAAGVVAADAAADAAGAVIAGDAVLGGGVVDLGAIEDAAEEAARMAAEAAHGSADIEIVDAAAEEAERVGDSMETMIEDAAKEAATQAGTESVGAIPQADDVAEAAAGEIADAAGDAAGKAVTEGLSQGMDAKQALDAGLEAAQGAIDDAVDKAAQEGFEEAVEGYADSDASGDSIDPELAKAVDDVIRDVVADFVNA
jgi:hypothetical protein